jgi:hypothetical protein
METICNYLGEVKKMDGRKKSGIVVVLITALIVGVFFFQSFSEQKSRFMDMAKRVMVSEYFSGAGWQNCTLRFLRSDYSTLAGQSGRVEEYGFYSPVDSGGTEVKMLVWYKEEAQSWIAELGRFGSLSMQITLDGVEVAVWKGIPLGQEFTSQIGFIVLHL